MMDVNMAEITLRVPGRQEYVLVLRTALGGVAVLKDLHVDALDDLRMAVDEACDCLLHQGRKVAQLLLNVFDRGQKLTVRVEAEFDGTDREACEDMTGMSKAILEALIPQVDLTLCPCGCIQGFDLTLPKAM